MATDLSNLGKAIRLAVIEQSHRVGIGHIGSSLSVADILAAVFGGVLRGDPDDPDRDRFVMSKGHAALALYAALVETGRMPAVDLETFCGDGTVVGVHPERAAAGVDFATGSLGQGLPIGAGAALAARLAGSQRDVLVILSDAECNEGSVWEAAMFAAHRRLGNLVAIVDDNGQQAFGYTDEVLSTRPLAERWRAFGWDVNEVDGHDAEALASTIASFDRSGLPHLIVADTTFGKGVSFMESLIEWHYKPMSDNEYRQALDELSHV